MKKHTNIAQHLQNYVTMQINAISRHISTQPKFRNADGHFFTSQTNATAAERLTKVPFKNVPASTIYPDNNL
jgi:hypothetical protein